MISGKEILEMEIGEYPMLIDGLLPKYGIAALGGSSDTGKSCLLRDISISVVDGSKDFIGQEIQAEHKSVVYVSTEDEQRSLAPLFKKQLENANPEDYKNLYFYFGFENIYELLEEHLQAHPTDLGILDCYGDIFGKDTNNISQVRKFLNKFSALAEKYSCCILFLHHFGKARNEHKGSKHSFLGSQAFEGKMRAALTLVKEHEYSDVRILQMVKGNGFSPECKKKLYRLNFDKNLRFSLLNHAEAKSSTSNDDKEFMIDMADLLLEEGKGWKDIVKHLNEEGFTCKKSTLHRWHKQRHN